MQCESKSCKTGAEATQVSHSGLNVCDECFDRLKQIRSAQTGANSGLKQSMLMKERMEIIDECKSLSVDDIRLILKRGD